MARETSTVTRTRRPFNLNRAWRHACHVYRSFGWAGVRATVRWRFSGQEQLVSLPVPGSLHECLVRFGGSDPTVYVEVLLKREYFVPFASPPAVVVDAGANTGLSALFFATMYPSARIFAIEPESTNYELLLRNTRALPSITPIRAALVGKPGQVDVVDPGDGPWGFQARNVAEPSESRVVEQVDGLTVDQLLQKYGIEHIDLLKMDIEGAELEVMADSRTWLSKVDTIVAELHDRFRRGCSLSFYSATNSFPFEWHRGENVFVSRSVRGADREQ